jgi:hypothetical protein
MELTKEMLSSAFSELESLHKQSHEGKSYQEQLNKLEKGEMLGCPICDVGGKIFNDNGTSLEMDQLCKRFFPEVSMLTTIMSMDFHLRYGCIAFLTLGMIIGKKQAEVEQMERLR